MTISKHILHGILITGFFFLSTSLVNSQRWVEMISNPGTNFFDIQKEFIEYWKDRPIDKGKGWKQFKRWEAFMMPRAYPSGHIPFDALWLARNDMQESHNFLKAGSNKYWQPIGPFSLPAFYGGAGRLNCVEVDPQNPAVIYVGAPSGGLWKSVDNGKSWLTTTDNLLSIGVTDIAIDYTNTNVIYIATGDGDFSDTYSIGVFKSIDGGASWNPTGLGPETGFNVSDMKTINRIIIHPSNPAILLAATSAGIYKTIDAGKNWKKIIGNANFKDIKFKPGNPDIIYAASTKYFYISNDAGDNFQVNSSIRFKIAVSRLAIGITPADADCVYLLAGAYGDGGYAGLYRSLDGGANFTLQSSSPNILGWKVDASDTGGQAFYDLAIAVSPVNREIVYVGGINIWKSSNGGQSWNINSFWVPGNKIPYVHADIHMLKFINSGDSDLFACSDGGLSITADAGKTWNDFSNGLAIAQIYRFGISQSEPSTILSGWQDNGGNLFYRSKWFKVMGGDCMESIIDDKNNFMYISLYNGKIQRSFNNGIDWAFITDDILNVERGDWITPLVIHPDKPEILYAAFQNVWKTTNKGNSWSKISDFNESNTFIALAVAPSDDKYIYAATYNSIYHSADGGNSWRNISEGLPLENAAITSMAVSHSNPQKLWVTFSGYVGNIKVYTSANAGSDWQNYSIGIPNIPVNCIVREKNSNDDLYIGTDVGVYFRDASLNAWIPYMHSLPNVIVNELEILYSEKKLRAATYGRGLWEVALYSSVGINEIFSSSFALPLNIFPNPADDFINITTDDKIYGNSELSIFNLMGQIVHRSNDFNNNQLIRFNSAALTDGVYHVRLSNAGEVYSGSFVRIRK